MKLPAFFSSLRVVLALQVALPVLAALALVLVAAMSLFGHFVESRMQRDLQLVARAIHLPVTQALARGDIEQLESSLASAFGMTEVYGAYLFDADGRRLVGFGMVSPTRRQAGDALKLTLEGEFAQYENIRGQNVYSFFLPLFDSIGQPNGLLQVTRLRSDIEHELSQLRRRAWGGFGAAALIILVVFALAHRRAVGRPLSALVDSMQRVEEGELGHRAAQLGPVEIRQLSHRLNGMLDAIQRAEIREREQREEQLRMKEQLRKSETLAALGQLSAGVAHELGAPLSVVDGRARRLMRATTDDDETRELQEIRDQVARMTSIVQQLLAFARGSRAEHRTLDAESLVRRAWALTQDEGLAPQLALGPLARFSGDSLGLEQALVNLVRNARQACPQGPVTLGWEVCEGKLVLYVEDGGPGIAEGERAQIFDPFYTTKAPGEGTGLGLAIVYRIMREHGGEVRIGTARAGGARFELWLAAVPDEAGTTEDEA